VLLPPFCFGPVEERLSMSCASILFPIRNQARVPGDNDEKVQLIVPRILLELTSDTAFLSAMLLVAETAGHLPTTYSTENGIKAE
jgi:hypothetical protein